MSDQMLLIENSGYNIEFNLAESNSSKGTLKFKGKLQEAETVNKNKRMYPYSVLNDNVQRLMDLVKKRGLIGELDHAADSIIHFKDASHIITKLTWEGNVLMGEGEILTTPMGRVFKALLEDGIPVGMSSRGVGNGKVNESGILVIGESYRLITFDAVADPSTHNAFQERVVSDKRENQNYSAKNENNNIYNLSKDAVIAALGGIVKQNTNNIKRGLNG